MFENDTFKTVFTFDVFFSAETTCTARWHVFYIRNRRSFSQLFCLQVRSVTPMTVTWQEEPVSERQTFKSGYSRTRVNSGLDNRISHSICYISYSCCRMLLNKTLLYLLLFYSLPIILTMKINIFRMNASDVKNWTLDSSSP